MNKAELLTKIKGLKQIEPSDSWVASNKSFVFEYIKTKEAEEKKIFVFEANIFKNLGNLFLRLKNSGLAIPAVSAAIVLIFGGNFLLVKAAGSLPGDALYPLKLTAEKIQLSLTLNEDKRAALTFEFTEKRLNEYYFLTADGSGNVASDQSVKIAAENLKSQLNVVSTELESAKSKLGTQKTVAMAKIAGSKTAAYGKKLKDTKATAEIIDKIDEVNTSALTVLATNADASDSKEVAAKVEEKIKSSEEKIGLIEQKILAVMVEQVRLNGGLAEEARNHNSSSASKDSLTPKLISEAKGILQEAKSALANNDHSKALELVVSSDQISKVAGKIVDAANSESNKENTAPGLAPAANTSNNTFSTPNNTTGTGAAPATETPKPADTKAPATKTPTPSTRDSQSSIRPNTEVNVNYGSPTSIDSAPAEK